MGKINKGKCHEMIGKAGVGDMAVEIKNRSEYIKYFKNDARGNVKCPVPCKNIRKLCSILL